MSTNEGGSAQRPLRSSPLSQSGNTTSQPAQRQASAGGPANPLDRMKMMYGGRAPSSRAEALKNQLKQRKFFDSGDYALSKAGSAKPNDVEVLEIGSEHPRPDRLSRFKPQSPSQLSSGLSRPEPKSQEQQPDESPSTPQQG